MAHIRHDRAMGRAASIWPIRRPTRRNPRALLRQADEQRAGALQFFLSSVSAATPAPTCCSIPRCWRAVCSA